MWMPLRQATNSQEMMIGPFFDKTDGDTELTALSIANTDIRLWREGGSTWADKNSGGGTHVEGGEYLITFDAVDTATAGKMKLRCHKSGSLIVLGYFIVYPQPVYDWLFLFAEFMPTDPFKANWSVINGVLTVYKPDGVTPAYTKNLTSDSSADPITGAS